VNRAPGLVRSTLSALRPGPSPWAVAAALRTVAAAGAVALLAATLGDVQVLSVVYLGAACSVAFVRRGTYREQAVALLAQSAGAALGITAGALSPHSTAGTIAVAAVAGLVSGLAGGLGPSAPGFGMMLGVGVAFGQFNGSSLPWWQQLSWYLVGTAAVGSATLVPWLWRRGVREREAVAELLAAAAELATAIGTPDGRPARERLAAASARARGAAHHVQAELVAFTAAAAYARGHPVPPDAVAAIRTAGAQVRRGLPIAVRLDHHDDPELQALADALDVSPSRPGAPLLPRWRLRAALRSVVDRSSVVNGVRIALCLGGATALTLALHQPDHSFWLPLTVAVIVCPEYASVFVRTVNRIAGTVLGAVLAVAVLVVWSNGVPVAVAAALALGAAVLTAPKLYAWSVIGVTASALLSASIARADPLLPVLRLLDTILGALVAVVVGYLLWPGARRLPATVDLQTALAAARAYLALATRPPQERPLWQTTRDDAYRLAHRARGAAEAALLEPPPVSALAATAVVVAAELEDTVDLVTAVASATDVGHVPTDLVDDVEHRLDALSHRIPERRGRRHA
jgi:hypothetical protein